MPPIRHYQPGDAAGLAGLLSVLGYPTDPNEIELRIERMSPDRATLIAEVDGEVIGFIGLMSVQSYEAERPIGYILALSVDPACQGQGVGKALVTAAEDWFRAQGIHDIRVNSGLQREGAHRFYEKAGFTITGHRFRKVLTP